MDIVKQALEGMGLNEKEIRVYLILLQTGMCPGSVLAQRTELPRSSAHFTCRQLAKKGVATVTQKNSVYYFMAEPPEKLLYLLEQRQKKLERQEEKMRNAMAPLKEMMTPHSSLPKVQYYEGLSGIIQGYGDFLGIVPQNGTLLATLSPYETGNIPDRARSELGRIQEELNGFRGSRMKKHVFLRAIAFRGPTAEGMQADDAHWLRETRIIEQPLPACPGEIMVYGDHVFSCSVQEHVVFATITHNAGIASIEQSLFELGWSAATPAKKIS